MEIDPILIREILTESLWHAIAMAPALFAVFVLMEVVSHGARPMFISSALRHGVVGPIAAAGLGLLPQCGFSVAATMMYVEGMVPAGSLLASYIATSDEAVPILVANPATLPWVVPLLAIKLVWGAVVGIGVNATARTFRGARAGKRSVRPSPTESHAVIHTHAGNCVGEKARVRDYLPHALFRTARTVAMVFVLSALLDLAGEIAQARLPGALAEASPWQPLAASFLGLIPSCATSVTLAEGFRAGLVSFPALLSGLTSNSGMGLLVLLKESKDRPRTLLIVGLLIASAYTIGYLARILY